MNNLWSFADRLRSKRSLRGLSQRDLGALVQMTRDLIKRFELGTARPTRSLVNRLAQALGIAPGDLIHGTDWRPPEKGGRLPASKMRKRCDWRPSQPCQTASCIKTALEHHQPTIARYLARIGKRKDLLLVRRFLREVSCSSYLEGYFLLALLAAGARPVWEAPLRVGFRHLPVLLRKKQGGDCRHPALEIEVDGIRILIMFQVGLQPPGAPIRVDGLVAVGLRRRKARWQVCEVDGPFHDPESDGERQGRHDLPEIRLPKSLFGKVDVFESFMQQLRQNLAIPSPTPEHLRVDWKQRRATERAQAAAAAAAAAAAMKA